jgi:hypothetical protein
VGYVRVQVNLGINELMGNALQGSGFEMVQKDWKFRAWFQEMGGKIQTQGGQGLTGSSGLDRAVSQFIIIMALHDS